MTRRVWIHIGLHKTGSTALQQRFEAGREALARAGILFPRTGIDPAPGAAKANAHRGHGKIVRMLREDVGQRRTALFAALEREIETAGADDVVLSSEMFAAPGQPLDIEALKRFAGPRETKIVVYLRRQDHWIESYYLERLTWRARYESRDFETFVREEADTMLDFRARLRPWADAFGQEALSVRFYDDIRRGGGDTALDFLALVGGAGLDLPEPGRERDSMNPSLPRSYCEIARAFNGFKDFDRVTRARFMRELLDGAPDDPPGVSLMSDALWAQIADRFREDNRLLAARHGAPEDSAFLFAQDRPPVRPSEPAVSAQHAALIISALARALAGGEENRGP